MITKMQNDSSLGEINSLLEEIKVLERRILMKTRKVSMRIKGEFIAPYKKAWGPGRKLPPEIREAIVEFLKENEHVSNIRRDFNVSIPTIQKIKKEEGLTRPYTHHKVAA